MPGIIHTNCSKLEREYCGKQARLNSTNMYEYELRSIATGDRVVRSKERFKKDISWHRVYIIHAEHKYLLRNI